MPMMMNMKMTMCQYHYHHDHYQWYYQQEQRATAPVRATTTVVGTSTCTNAVLEVNLTVQQLFCFMALRCCALLCIAFCVAKHASWASSHSHTLWDFCPGPMRRVTVAGRPNSLYTPWSRQSIASRIRESSSTPASYSLDRAALWKGGACLGVYSELLRGEAAPREETNRYR